MLWVRCLQAIHSPALVRVCCSLFCALPLPLSIRSARITLLNEGKGEDRTLLSAATGLPTCCVAPVRTLMLLSSLPKKRNAHAVVAARLSSSYRSVVHSSVTALTPQAANLDSLLTRILFTFIFLEVHAYIDSARPQRKQVKPWQGRLPLGGGPAREPMTGQHVHMPAKKTTTSQGVLEFASITQRSNAEKAWLGSNEPINCFFLFQGRSCLH